MRLSLLPAGALHGIVARHRDGRRDGMKLYWNVRCGSFAPEAVAAEAGVAYERIRADHRANAPEWQELKRLNPMAQIPTAVLDDGRVITESAALTLDFADRGGLLPAVGSPDRAWALRWLMMLACAQYPMDLLESYPGRYTTDPKGTEAVSAAGSANIDRGWEVFEAELGEGPYLLGETFSAVDPYAAMLLAWHREPKALLARHPKLKRLLEATVARPKIAPLWAEYELGSRLS
jgi:glutathione S-transferase